MMSTAYHLPHQKAFTLIELLVVVAISSLLFGFGFSAYRKAQERQSIKNSAKRIETLLRSIQKKALVGDKDCQGYLKYYQVTINAHNNTLTQQAICQLSNGSAQTYSVSNATFNNGCTIHFQPLQQGLVITSPDASSCDLILSLDSNPNITQTVKIAQPGLILVK